MEKHATWGQLDGLRSAVEFGEARLRYVEAATAQKLKLLQREVLEPGAMVSTLGFTEQAAMSFLSRFPETTGWCLLVVLALYDLCAVLTPCGPLKALVDAFEPLNSLLVGKAIHTSAASKLPYDFFWLSLITLKLWFSYCFQIRPLVEPTRERLAPLLAPLLARVAEGGVVIEWVRRRSWRGLRKRRDEVKISPFP